MSLCRDHRMVQLASIVLICCLAQFGVDIIAPAQPAIAHGFGTRIDTVQWGMSLYMLALTVGQLCFGPWADIAGRRLPMLIGMCLFTAGSLICVFAPSIQLLLIGRVIQGLGGGACSLWRSIFRDMYTGDELAKVSAYLGTFITFIIPAAPLVGGFMEVHFGWRAIFIFISVYAIISASLIMFILQETKASTQSKSKTIAAFKEIINHRTFLFYTVCVFLSYGGYFAWFVAGPVLWIKVMHYSSASFGVFSFVIGVCAMMLAGIMNAKFVKKYGRGNLLRFGWSILLLSAMFFIVTYLWLGLTIYTVTIAVLLFYFGSPFIYSNVYASAFTPVGHIAGVAAAVYSAIQSLGAFALGSVIAYLPSTNPLPLMFVMLLAPAAAWLTYEVFCHKYNTELD